MILAGSPSDDNIRSGCRQQDASHQYKSKGRYKKPIQHKPEQYLLSSLLSCDIAESAIPHSVIPYPFISFQQMPAARRISV
jgi:hypothetical protein